MATERSAPSLARRQRFEPYFTSFSHRRTARFPDRLRSSSHMRGLPASSCRRPSRILDFSSCAAYLARQLHLFDVFKLSVFQVSVYSVSAIRVTDMQRSIFQYLLRFCGFFRSLSLEDVANPRLQLTTSPYFTTQRSVGVLDIEFSDQCSSPLFRFQVSAAASFRTRGTF